MINESTIDRAYIQHILSKHGDKLRPIKVFLTDVDGVLTNGLINYQGEEVGFNRYFHAHDGHGMRLLQRGGLKTGFISGGDSKGMIKRAHYLNLDYLFYGSEDKLPAFEKICADGFLPHEILFIGDDLFDIPVLKRVGFSVAPPEAVFEVREMVDHVTKIGGGKGAVREVVDLVRYAQALFIN